MVISFYFLKYCCCWSKWLTACCSSIGCSGAVSIKKLEEILFTDGFEIAALSIEERLDDHHLVSLLALLNTHFPFLKARFHALS